MMMFMKRTASNSPSSPDGSAPKPLRELLQAGAGANLIDRALLLQTLDRQLRQYLPEPLAGQCSLANVRADKLVFLVTSPAWKASLRLHEHELVAAARRCGLQVDHVVAKVATILPVSPEPASRKPLSQAARDHLREAARSIDDPELRAQLLAMASMP